jgi:holin-like protein
MNILGQVGIVIGICLLGELISAILPFTFPASIICMLLLLLQQE